MIRNADVMELVDMQDLGSCVERRVGSSPFIRTKIQLANEMAIKGKDRLI